jgi:hypothetical protein
MTEPSSNGVDAPKPKSFLQKFRSILKLVLINFLIFAVLAELASLVWHRPNGHFVHKGGCYTVEYDTNSYGARDVERSVHSSAPRTIVLGDSFIEGLGTSADVRLTNILERDTGRRR